MNIYSTIEATKIRPIGQGQGLNSEVFLCYDPQIDGEIVIKEIPIGKFPNALAYFKEAKALYANKHSKVVPVMYACKDVSSIRIAMPFYKNGTLEDLLNTKRLTTKEVIHITEQFLLGLHHIHSNDYIHYDIKPTNILFSDDGTPMVSDFGQSRETNHLGVSEIPPLYPSHIVPEAFVSTHATKQSDIFQVGLTMYRMCNGNDYFRSQFNFKSNQDFFDAISNGRFPSRDRYLPHVPLKLRRIIKKCLDVNPANRFQTCLELQNELVTVRNLLDWKFDPSPTGKRWIKDSLLHEDIIEVSQNNKGKWQVVSFKRRKSDGHTRNYLTQCKNGLLSQKDAEEYVYRLFRRLE